MVSVGAALRGTQYQIERELHRVLETDLETLRPHMGQWTVAWGPGVYKHWFSRYSENTMCVFEKQAHAGESPRLVISVAGTNQYSLLAWLQDDLSVLSEVRWEYGHPPEPEQTRISHGTFNGLCQLQHIRPSRLVAGHHNRLRDFLATKTASPIQIKVVGHSLGGALAPTLALWLSDTRDQWDPSNNATLSCAAYAGPTPGNSQFASYFDSQLGSQTMRVYNRLDIVPKFWTVSGIESVHNVYEPHISPTGTETFLFHMAKELVEHKDYAHIMADVPSFDSTVNPSPQYSAFLSQALYQHEHAYFEHAGLNQSNFPIHPVHARRHLSIEEEERMLARVRQEQEEREPQ